MVVYFLQGQCISFKSAEIIRIG